MCFRLAVVSNYWSDVRLRFSTISDWSIFSSFFIFLGIKHLFRTLFWWLHLEPRPWQWHRGGWPGRVPFCLWFCRLIRRRDFQTISTRSLRALQRQSQTNQKGCWHLKNGMVSPTRWRITGLDPKIKNTGDTWPNLTDQIPHLVWKKMTRLPMNGMANPTRWLVGLDTRIHSGEGTWTILVKDLSKKEINLIKAVISNRVPRSILASHGRRRWSEKLLNRILWYFVASMSVLIISQGSPISGILPLFVLHLSSLPSTAL